MAGEKGTATRRDGDGGVRAKGVQRAAPPACVLAIACFLALLFPGYALAEGLDPADTPPPHDVVVLERPVDAGRRIALTWSSVEGAFGYRVYRSRREEGPYEAVGGKGAESMADYPVFLDEQVEPGVDYWYRVSVVTGDGSEGPLTPPVRACVKPGFVAAGGAKRMICSLYDQKIYFFEGDQLVNVMRCSTGLNNRTPTGNFRILAHYRVHTGLGGAVCDYWMSFTSAHGMHAWPRSTRNTYETGLGRPASHGCIRLHPLEAYWPYHWAPDGTPLTVTYASLSKRVISGCHASLGAVQAATEWYFAEGYTAEGYDTFLLLFNPGERDADVVVDFHREDGTSVSQPCLVRPHSRFTLTVDHVAGMEATAFSARIRSDNPIVAERAVYFAAPGGRDDGTVSVGTTRLGGEWYFAEGCTAGGFDTYLLFSNPGDVPAEVVVDFFLEGGGEVGCSFRIPARSRCTLPVDAYPGMESVSFSTRVRSSEPITAERAMYFNKGYIGGGHASVGAQRPSTTWYFAEGCTRGFFETYILVGNPGDEDTVVHVDYHLPEGDLGCDYLVRARSRLNIPVNSQAGAAGKDVAFTITSGEPVVVERAMYYGLDSRRGGHVSLGAAAPSTEWYFAEGYTDGAFDTYLLFSNPGTSAAAVTVVFQREDGATFYNSFRLDSHRRHTLHVDDLPGLERAAFSARIDSDRPVVAERSVYFVMTLGY